MKIFKNKTIDQVKDLINKSEFLNQPYFITFAGHETKGFIVWELRFCNCNQLNEGCYICGKYELIKLSWFLKLKSAIEFLINEENPTFLKNGCELIKIDHEFDLLITKYNGEPLMSDSYLLKNNGYYNKRYQKQVVYDNSLTRNGIDLRIRLMSNKINKNDHVDNTFNIKYENGSYEVIGFENTEKFKISEENMKKMITKYLEKDSTSK